MSRTMRKLSGVTMVAGLSALTLAGPAAAHHGRPFRTALSGANEVPANPHGAAERGGAWIKLDERRGRVCWKFAKLTLTAGEALPTAAHIHNAAAGTAGPVVVTLFTGAAAPASYPTPVTCVAAAADVIQRIRQDPAQYYVNMHNAAHPSGVVRGQLAGPRRTARADHPRSGAAAERDAGGHGRPAGAKK